MEQLPNLSTGASGPHWSVSLANQLELVKQLSVLSEELAKISLSEESLSEESLSEEIAYHKDIIRKNLSEKRYWKSPYLNYDLTSFKHDTFISALRTKIYTLIITTIIVINASSQIKHIGLVSTRSGHHIYKLLVHCIN